MGKNEDQTIENFDFQKLIAAIKQVEDDLCIAVDYEALDFIEQMRVNFMLNVHSNGVYTFFDLVQRIVDERVHMKKELEHYKSRSAELEIKLKKYLGQWREVDRPEIDYMKLT